MACAERWAARIGGPAYAIDDETAIKVVDGEAEVISEGHTGGISVSDGRNSVHLVLVAVGHATQQLESA